MKKNTNWSQATFNPFVAFLKLVSCLRAGHNAWIERQENGKQDFPLTEKNPDLYDIKNWKSSGAYFVPDWQVEKERIENDKNKHPFEKKMMLEYTTAFGTEEEYQHYLNTGEVKFRGMGRQFFVKHDDLVKTRESEGISMNDKTRFVLMVSPVEQWKRVVKTNRKVYVVCWNNEKSKLPLWFKMWNALVYPFKFIPTRSVLRMDEYTLYTFRIGDVRHGYSVQFHIPKKFSLK
jgi:hypothetical protein